MGVRASNQVLALTHEAWKRLNSLASANTSVHSQFLKPITWRKFLRRAWACTLTHSHRLICYIGFRTVPIGCVRRTSSEHFLVLPRCPPPSLRGKDSSFLPPIPLKGLQAQLSSGAAVGTLLAGPVIESFLSREKTEALSFPSVSPACRQKGREGFPLM